MVSSTFGPVAGGWLTQHFGWHSVFLINLPLGALAAVLALRLPNRTPPRSRLRFDWLGLVLFAGFVVALLLALERGQRISYAAIPAMAGLVLLAATCLWLLLRQERRTNMPLIPVALLRLPAIWRADAMGACVGASSSHASPSFRSICRWCAGRRRAGWGCCCCHSRPGLRWAPLLTGRMIARTGKTAVFPSFGLISVTLCLMFLALGAGLLPTLWLPAVFLALSVSLGTAMPVVQTTVQMVAGPKNLGAASASVQFSRSIGAALGTALVGAVLFAVLTATDAKTAALFAEIVQRGPAVLDGLDAAQRAVVATEIGSAFRAAFMCIAAFSGIGLVLAWSLPVRRI